MVDYVFVYGTLKDHPLMFSIGCEKLGIAETEDKFILVVEKETRIPFIIPEEKLPSALKSFAVKVRGILYKLPEDAEKRRHALEMIDRYEKAPSMYVRKVIKVKLLIDNSEYEAYVYVPSEKILDSIISCLRNGYVFEMDEDGWYDG